MYNRKKGVWLGASPQPRAAAQMEFLARAAGGLSQWAAEAVGLLAAERDQGRSMLRENARLSRESSMAQKEAAALEEKLLRSEDEASAREHPRSSRRIRGCWGLRQRCGAGDVDDIRCSGTRIPPPLLSPAGSFPQRSSRAAGEPMVTHVACLPRSWAQTPFTRHDSRIMGSPQSVCVFAGLCLPWRRPSNSGIPQDPARRATSSFSQPQAQRTPPGSPRKDFS